MKICVKCSNHEGTTFGPIGLHFCLARDVRHEESTNPVTGEKQYKWLDKNGNPHYSDEKYPMCQTINPEGKCPHFVPNH